MSYLEDLDDEDTAQAPAPSTPADPADPALLAQQISEFKPASKPRDRGTVSQAVKAGRERGFDRPTSIDGAKAPKAAKAKEPAPARVFVTLDTVPDAGVTGQIAVSGDALEIYQFARRASWERMTRGQLLSAMLALWIETHGDTPADFQPRR